MATLRQVEHLLLRSRRLPALVIALALAVLAAVIAAAALQTRHRIRAQIAGRDGEVLYAVALMQFAEDVEQGLADEVLSPGNQLSVALKSSQLRGVLGVRLFDPAGRFVECFPPSIIEGEFPPDDLPVLRTLQPVSRFRPRAEMAGLFYPEKSAPMGTIPLLEVNVPLHAEGAPLAGIAQFLVEGHSIAAEYRRLDRHLARQALLAFAAAGAILTIALAWAFRRLRRAHQLLTERTENLVRANQELALAAKTSALGVVAAHLIHGLKNPLAGLHSYVASRASAPEGNETSEWEEAVATTRRMQAMIAQVVGVLREEQTGASYEVTLKELEEIVRNRVQPQARERNVSFTTVIHAEARLPNRTASLLALILVNLLENALQATPAGKSVTLTISRAGQSLELEVRDEGSGFPADTPLFMPCRSSKEGGSGVGLALCRQLANHLGAELGLASSTNAGCVFRLTLPDSVNAPKNRESIQL
jgi:signal transduction histidine kinase